MKKLWKELIDCGYKSVGTNEKLKAEELLFNELRNISPATFKDEFYFEGWGITNPSKLEMIHPQKKEYRSWVFLGSGNGNFEGQVRYIGKNYVWNMYAWERYGVFSGDKIVAYISGRPEGRLISQTLVEGNSIMPHFIIDEQDNRELMGLLDDGIDVRVKGETHTYIDKNMRGCNIILPLKSSYPEKRKIIVCAHYDTMYNTKGAFDNGSGAVVIVEMARILSKMSINRDIDFVLTDAEECRLEGAKSLASRTNPDDIEFLLNVDGAGRGDILELWCGYEAFEREIIEYLLLDDTFETKIYKNPPPPGSDHVPFYNMGVNCCEITVNDQDLLHMPEDDFQLGVLENMKRLLPLALKLIKIRD